jgi:PRTRC genetic system protein A
VFIEIRRPWFSLVRQIAAFNVRTAIPYGRVTPSTRLLCETIPADLVGAFAEMARKAHPRETGAWIVWSPSTQAFRLAPVGIVTHTAGALKYQPPALAGDEVLVMDCHSHGGHPAYFSSTDNDDDRHDVKMALVIGNCDRPTPSIVVRLCAKGIFEETECAPATWYQAARVPEAV